MAINYSDRKIFWGNELMVMADLVTDSQGKVTAQNAQLVTGLVSVGSMEDQAETTSYPADDVPDHGQKKGATLLQGEIVFIQTDQTVRQEMLGEQKTANGLGWSPTGNYKSKAVQYLHKAQRRNALTGQVEEGYMITLYPNMTATAEATKESETDSTDGVDPIQWTVPVQATASEKYLNNGKKVPSIEYEVWGDQAKAFMSKMEEGLFIMFPDTVIGTPATLTVPTISSTVTATTNGNNGTLVLPTTLKDTKGNDVPVTYVVKNSSGQTVTNGQLAPGSYTVVFSANGYPDVTATTTVTNKPS